MPAQAAAALDNAGDGRASPQGLARGIDECTPTHPACRGPLALAPHSATMARAAHAVHRTMVQGVEWGGPLAGGLAAACGLSAVRRNRAAMSKLGDELIQSLKEALAHAQGDGPGVVHAPESPHRTRDRLQATRSGRGR